jgi:hypothetical protein
MYRIILGVSSQGISIKHHAIIVSPPPLAIMDSSYACTCPELPMFVLSLASMVAAVTLKTPRAIRCCLLLSFLILDLHTSILIGYIIFGFSSVVHVLMCSYARTATVCKVDIKLAKQIQIICKKIGTGVIRKIYMLYNYCLYLPLDCEYNPNLCSILILFKTNLI